MLGTIWESETCDGCLNAERAVLRCALAAPVLIAVLTAVRDETMIEMEVYVSVERAPRWYVDCHRSSPALCRADAPDCQPRRNPSVRTAPAAR